MFSFIYDFTHSHAEGANDRIGPLRLPVPINWHWRKLDDRIVYHAPARLDACLLPVVRDVPD